MAREVTLSVLSVYDESGNKIDIPAVQGTDGVDGISVTAATVNTSGRLLLTLSSGDTIDCGVVRGADGADGKSITSIVRTTGDGSAGSTDTYTITYSDNTTATFSIHNGIDGTDGQDGYTPQKDVDYFDGKDGNDGLSPTITITEIDGGNQIDITDVNGTKTFEILDGEKGDPGVYVGETEPTDVSVQVWVKPTGDTSTSVLYVRNAEGTFSPISTIQGSAGNDGRGITSIERTSGDGSAGTTDTYTITYTDETTSTFVVYNGKDGESGDAAGTANSVVSTHNVATDAHSDLFAGKADIDHTHTAEEVGADATGTAASAISEHDASTDAHSDLFNAKQDKLTFDSVPTENSTNPVTSGGVYTAIANASPSDSVSKSGDEMNGILTAYNNTEYITGQVRNVYLVENGGELPEGGNGDICIIYKVTG